jgi:hypothetical protein
MGAEARPWKIYSMITTLLIGVLAVSAFTVKTQRAKFKEIDVERIHVAGPDGKWQMVISSRENMPMGRIEGKDIPESHQGGDKAGDETTSRGREKCKSRVHW